MKLTIFLLIILLLLGGCGDISQYQQYLEKFMGTDNSDTSTGEAPIEKVYQTENCFDSDGGIEPHIKGQCKYSSDKFVEDTCSAIDGSGPLKFGAYVNECFCLSQKMRDHCKQTNSAEYCDNLPDNAYSEALLPHPNLAETYFEREEWHYCKHGCYEGVCLSEEEISDCKHECKDVDFGKSVCRGDAVITCADFDSDKCFELGETDKCLYGCYDGKCGTEKDIEQGLPDLTIELFSVEPTNPAEGDMINTTINVSNIGDASINIYRDSFWVSIYTNSWPETPGIRIISYRPDVFLSPGESILKMMSFKYKGEDHIIELVVDDVIPNQIENNGPFIEEINEANNKITVNLTEYLGKYS